MRRASVGNVQREAMEGEIQGRRRRSGRWLHAAVAVIVVVVVVVVTVASAAGGVMSCEDSDVHCCCCPSSKDISTHTYCTEQAS